MAADPSDIATVDVAIVGAGLCGLALARSLCARGLRVLLLEARERLGGRVLSTTCVATAQSLDLGPTWFWPETEPRMAGLLEELGLPLQAQHDPGDALWLTDPNRAPETRPHSGGVHGGAQRIQGGAAVLVQALAQRLDSHTLRLNAAVQALHDRGSHIALQLVSGASIRAHQVVLALPPRLVHERLLFTPSLPQGVLLALQATPTWMAAQAKALTTYADAFWRRDGHSGNAFVRHPQAVLAEVFDCGGPDASRPDTPGALGGFVALNAAQRQHFSRGLPLLIESQLAQLFGAQAQGGTLHLQDWAAQPWTCSEADRTQPPEPPQCDPLLRQPLWGGRLLLGGSETAAHGAGHMEGALESADRLAHALLRGRTAGPMSVSAPPGAPAAQAAPSRAAALGAFSASVVQLRALAPQRYRQHLTRLLQAQHSEQLTQRALLATAEQCYSEALERLDPLLAGLQPGRSDVVQGRHGLNTALLAPFEGWSRALLDAALLGNASSCALSNFPQEQQPDAHSLRAITLDLGAAWREFAIELNTRLLVAANALPQEKAAAP